MPWLLSVSEDMLCHVKDYAVSEDVLGCEGLCRFMPCCLSVSEDVIRHVKDSVGSCPGSCLS